MSALLLRTTSALSTRGNVFKLASPTVNIQRIRRLYRRKTSRRKRIECVVMYRFAYYFLFLMGRRKTIGPRQVREALSGRASGSRWIQRPTTHTPSRVAPALRKHCGLSAPSSNRMASPSHLNAGTAPQRSPNQDCLPTSTPPTSPLNSSSPSHTNPNATCAGKRFLLDDAEMNVLETLAKENPDLLTHGVNLDIEETIACSPEDVTPPGLHEPDVLSPSSEQAGSNLNSERNSVPNVEIFAADSAESQRRTDSLVELGENIVAEAVQLAKATVEDMLLRVQEDKATTQTGGMANARGQTASPCANKGDAPANKAEEQKQTSELLDSLMNTPKPAARTSLTGEEADSLSEEPDNNEPDSEQMLDDASLSLHGHEEPETVSEESSSCLEPVRVPGAKSPTLEDIPDLPDDQDKKAKLRGKDRQVIEEVEEDDESQNSDTESHSPSPLDNYGRSRTVVRKVKKIETTTTVIQSESTMTAGTVEQPPPSAASTNVSHYDTEQRTSPHKHFPGAIVLCEMSGRQKWVSLIEGAMASSQRKELYWDVRLLAEAEWTREGEWKISGMLQSSLFPVATRSTEENSLRLKRVRLLVPLVRRGFVTVDRCVNGEASCFVEPDENYNDQDGPLLPDELEPETRTGGVNGHATDLLNGECNVSLAKLVMVPVIH
ncbi:hypothetical protein BIW11_13017 [Tropilaelaps mercedesae]|uniref:Uncharacterized protein n=1 Tax=Tropilaelaps mercedesae TaxID=418985 RepID=A0A1V9X4F5_9ACAR|nr:hypothetical protein BIW11_13017 [Tropilaelaps mercedesae]